MGIEPKTDWVPYAALAVSGLAFLTSWFGYRLAKRQVLHKRPYFDRSRYASDGRVTLDGPEKGQWEITKVRLIWPLQARFGLHDTEYDFGGSIVRSEIKTAGRILRDVSAPVFAVGATSTCYALVSASSKARPKISQRWVIRVKSIA